MLPQQRNDPKKQHCSIEHRQNRHIINSAQFTLLKCADIPDQTSQPQKEVFPKQM